mmetsp:Transcript_51135/g.119849  ORF Transcript_51135/g.119849 Transcript_51135/m.119849 type:complete len:371 (+) Transcript_51135:301-1413(+)
MCLSCLEGPAGIPRTIGGRIGVVCHYHPKPFVQPAARQILRLLAAAGFDAIRVHANKAIVLGVVEGNFPVAGRHHGKFLHVPAVWQGICILRAAGQHVTAIHLYEAVPLCAVQRHLPVLGIHDQEFFPPPPDRKVVSCPLAASIHVGITVHAQESVPLGVVECNDGAWLQERLQLLHPKSLPGPSVRNASGTLFAAGVAVAVVAQSDVTVARGVVEPNLAISHVDRCEALVRPITWQLVGGLDRAGHHIAICSHLYKAIVLAAVQGYLPISSIHHREALPVPVRRERVLEVLVAAAIHIGLIVHPEISPPLRIVKGDGAAGAECRRWNCHRHLPHIVTSEALKSEDGLRLGFCRHERHGRQYEGKLVHDV